MKQQTDERTGSQTNKCKLLEFATEGKDKCGRMVVVGRSSGVYQSFCCVMFCFNMGDRKKKLKIVV